MLMGILSIARQRAKEKTAKRKASKSAKNLKKASPKHKKLRYADEPRYVSDDIRLGEFLRASSISVNKNKYQKNINEALRAFCEKKGRFKNADIYRNADISKQTFYDLLKLPPSKETLIKVAFVLEVTLKKAKELLESADYSFRDYSNRDLVFQFCFKRGIFDFIEINELLKQSNEKPLIKEAKKLTNSR